MSRHRRAAQGSGLLMADGYACAAEDAVAPHTAVAQVAAARAKAKAEAAAEAAAQQSKAAAKAAAKAKAKAKPGEQQVHGACMPPLNKH